VRSIFKMFLLFIEVAYDEKKNERQPQEDVIRLGNTIKNKKNKKGQV